MATGYDFKLHLFDASQATENGSLLTFVITNCTKGDANNFSIGASAFVRPKWIFDANSESVNTKCDKSEFPQPWRK
jgi:hypothetical protein